MSTSNTPIFAVIRGAAQAALIVAAVLAIGFLGAGCSKEKGPDADGKREVMVFAAASLRDVLQEIATAYQKETGVHVLFNFAGSNDLAHQIIAAPRADLFVSASERWMDEVAKANRLENGTRSDLLSNTLVVIANSESTWSVPEPCAIAALPFRYLALGNPDAVPAGQYARQWMTTLQCGGHPLWDDVKDRVAPTPDVRAALSQVVASADMLGIVYRTDQLAFAKQTRVLFEVKDGPPIRYSIGRLTEAPNKAAAVGFQEYLRSAAARAVFEKHGFGFIDAKGPAVL